ncbi:hypothetical protein [Alysiella filiformis]|uniref:Roadblock/LAMTOR2 domain-containing protein n=1 Tax=Alysiella filiformis DSM 16848 TaxID=1120981 RepID=A0A286EGX4_9NEIS|nr:hypothetical protein [Alysiella filiformis]QMT32366.1 hypothetical protein H3L97_05940 [Alysiella filiformis]UBQ56714.1 hypothetical protein JF568_02750 [Alysiella filiformis DSM 16848]SOD70170.1 hypothetical protein SAMN02746062_02007 [Alysiella filiformis DSM 16848]
MQKLFPKTMQKIATIEGFQGAVIVNFGTKEVLDYQENAPLDLRQVGEVCANMVQRHANMVKVLELSDVAERILITTKLHYHIIYLVPQFESVAIYVIVKRYTMLSYVTQVVEDAVYSMH